MSIICYDDMIDSATRTYSSQNVLFPASNLYDQSVRGKVWRSAGYFAVTTANRVIIFQESVGVDLTATMTVVNHESITSFMSGIKDALDAAGASTYTVTRNASNKIVITSDGLGGGGVFRLMWTNVLSTAADTIGFSTAADDTGALTYTADLIRNHTTERLTWDLGASSNPDAFIAIGKKGQALKISENATIKLQGSSTSSFSSPEYEATLSYHELGLLKLKTSGAAGLHSSALRYWSLLITDRENANGYVELSNVFLGDYYQPATGKIQFPLNVSGIDFSSESLFKSGSKSYSRRGRTVSFGFKWFPLTTTEKEVFDLIEYEMGKSKAFYLIMDPDVVFGSSIEYSLRYVRFTSGLNLSLERPNIWTSSWSVEECL